MITTWTLVLALSYGMNPSRVFVVPNFESFKSCQAYGERLRSVYSEANLEVKECVPSDYGMPNNRGEKK